MTGHNAGRDVPTTVCPWRAMRSRPMRQTKYGDWIDSTSRRGQSTLIGPESQVDQLLDRSTMPPEWIGRISTPPPALSAGFVRAIATAPSKSSASMM